jgi:hypothetical protein
MIMKIKASKLKKWCDTKITPLAWQRVTLRALPVLSEHGIELEDLENPGDDLILEGEVMEEVAKIIEQFYDISLASLVEKS